MSQGPTSSELPPLSASDIPKGAWVDRWLPKAARPYARLARLDRPIGTWLLLFPCWWSTALAYLALGKPLDVEFLRLVVVFAIGAVVMRGAGCTFNDIVDRDFDRRVARTADRPIPSGQVTRRQAAAFMSLQMLIGLAVLVTLSETAILIGIASLVLVFSYPFMKRITYWPQAWLGLTFNWGALVGWAAVADDLALPAIVLYVGGLFWTLGYDTIYAHQDKEDDALIGVKSTALRLGSRTRPFLMVFYAAATALFAAAGALALSGSAVVESSGSSVSVLVASAILLMGAGAAAGHFAWQVQALRQDDPADCLRKFKSNASVGWILFAAPILATLWLSA